MRNISLKLKLWRNSLPLPLKAIIFHVFLMIFAFDINFETPIETGIRHTNCGSQPFAKRVALVIIDGLRAETLFDKHKDRTPFITSVLIGDNRAAWGKVTTQVPTETRPGHASILGGVFEDPMNMFLGWQNSLIEFDTVINTSNNAWSFGSPDVVNLFKKSDKRRHYTKAYSPNYQDFSGRISTVKLDDWAFDALKEVLEKDNQSCKRATEALWYNNSDAYSDVLTAQTSYNICMGNVQDEDLCVRRHLRDSKWHHVNPDENYFKYRGSVKTCNEPYNKYCGPICDNGNLFFLHLLGMDTAGHIHKPNSAKYLRNLMDVDRIVQDVPDVFKNFFGDDSTAFIVTSDHGMTNWGSHGDGSDHETMVPFLAWGAGIKPAHLTGMRQVDIAPLIGTLLCTPIPRNSMGILNVNMLKGSKRKIAYALKSNLEQLIERVNYHIQKHLQTSGNEKTSKLIATYNDLMEKELFGEAIVLSYKIMEEIQKNILGFQKLYYPYKMLSVVLSSFFWILYLILDMPCQTTIVEQRIFNNIQSYVTLATVILLGFATFATLKLIVTKANIFSHAYIIFPTILFINVIPDLIEKLSMLWYATNTNIIKRMLINCILMAFLILGFHNKRYYFFTMLMIPCWIVVSKSYSKLSDRLFTVWFILCLTLGSTLFIPHSTEFNKMYGAFGFGVWMLFYTGLFAHQSTIHQPSQVDCMKYMFGITLCGAYVYTSQQIHNNFTANKGLSHQHWVMALSSIGAAIISCLIQGSVVLKFIIVANGLLLPYIFMAAHLDTTIYALLILLLYCWINVEHQLHKGERLTILRTPARYLQYSRDVSFEDYRRAFCYINITLCYYFAICDTASISGFDPNWTKAFLSVFNRDIMMVIIGLKFTIPFIVITCAYFIVNEITSSYESSSFRIIMIFFDQLVIYFMFAIRTEGSWKDIGQSVSFFVVMNVMTLVLIFVYWLVRWIITIRWY